MQVSSSSTFVVPFGLNEISIAIQQEGAVNLLARETERPLGL